VNCCVLDLEEEFISRETTPHRISFSSGRGRVLASLFLNVAKGETGITPPVDVMATRVVQEQGLHFISGVEE